MTLDRDPLLRSSITALVIFDQEPPFAEVVERFAALCRRTRRFRSRVVAPSTPWDRPCWEEDRYFDVSTHLRHVRAAHPGDLRAVLDLAQSMAPMAFDPTRPLWEAIAVDGVIGDKAALIIRVHHALIDGVGGLLVAATMMDRDRAGHPLLAEQDGRSENTTTVQRGGLECVVRSLVGVPRQAVDAVCRVAADPADAASRWLDALIDAGSLIAPSPSPLSPLMRTRTTVRRFDTIVLESDQVHGAAAAAGLTLNDLFVAGILRGLSLYHHRHDIDIEHLRAIMPVSTRRPEDPLESNKFVPVRIVLPIDLTDARAYLRLVPDLLRRWKQSEALGTSEMFSFALDRLPASMTTRAMAMMLKGVDFVATDVPGPPTDVFFAGAQVEALYAFAPTAGAALNVALVTTAGRVNVGLNIDAGAVPDPDIMVACLTDGFDQVLEAAGAPKGAIE
ncbi:MAG: wax ester/triacylglycerol synthase domain-containing protein [Acidimicrobiales bacterium]